MRNKETLKMNGNSILPPSRPPETVPVFCETKMQISAETFKPVLNTYVYIWLVNGGSFWMYPKKIIDELVCGYVFTGEKWVEICMNNNLIKGYY